MSLPVLHAEGLPLGLQVIGFMNEDAALFAAAASILHIMDDLRRGADITLERRQLGPAPGR
jgi:Asp-tRNA(Asn)/Glu-tRNA(Gln) amidotransferase A subunit family amidase